LKRRKRQDFFLDYYIIFLYSNDLSLAVKFFFIPTTTTAAGGGGGGCPPACARCSWLHTLRVLSAQVERGGGAN
jgi:hypothetical protein